MTTKNNQPILIFDTLTRTIKQLRSANTQPIKLFVCGPTVYDYSHIGHARTYIIYDVIAKYLRSCGYNVNYLQNITDIDDKIIDRARAEGRSATEVAEEFKLSYFEDMTALGIDAVTTYAPATHYIPEIIDQVERLIAKGVGYVTASGSVYYSIEKFVEYGKLSRQKLEEIITGSRVELDPEKKHPADFVLWKAQKQPDEPNWLSPWGRGRPGWHIEDTAITEKHFGFHYDLHGGGIDLIFPHHEAEIAQMEVLSNQPLTDFWIHTGLLKIRDQKMSKSLKNFITIREFLDKFTKEQFRFFVLSAHYRSPVEFDYDSFNKTLEGWRRLCEFYNQIKDQTDKVEKVEKKAVFEPLAETWKQFHQVMSDDFNSAEALAVIFNLVRQLNPDIIQGKINKQFISQIRGFLEDINKIFGIFPSQLEVEKLPAEIEALVIKRNQARSQGNFNKADEIRKKLLDAGYEIRDTSQGTKVIKKLG